MSTWWEMGLLSNSMAALSRVTVLRDFKMYILSELSGLLPAALPPSARLALIGGVAFQLPGAS